MLANDVNNISFATHHRLQISIINAGLMRLK